MAMGRPPKYRDEFVDELVEYCAEGYSLTAFAGHIGVARSTINEWMAQHADFSEAVSRAKNMRAAWWEARARDVAMNGGPGGQATMVIFGLKNHAPEDFSDKTQHEHTGKDGGPIELSLEARQAATKAILDAAFGPEEKSE
jgi:hypothetical protein